jgi:hypothetical protein
MPGEYKQPQSFCVMLRHKDAKEAERIFSAGRTAELVSEDRPTQMAAGSEDLEVFEI